MSQSKEIFQEAMKRKPTQKQKIINMLREAGDEGVLNTVLVNVAGIRFNARISEMYTEGYKIDVKHIERGVCRYTLISEPTTERTSRPAIEIIQEQINNNYDGLISTKELLALLSENNFNIVRKSGSHK